MKVQTCSKYEPNFPKGYDSNLFYFPKGDDSNMVLISSKSKLENKEETSQTRVKTEL